MAKPKQRKQGTPTEIQPYDELVAERTAPFEGSVQIDFIFRHMVLKYSVKQAVEDVGISIAYGHKINRMWRGDAKFRSRIMKKLDSYPDDYRDACRSLLPVILKTEVEGLRAMQDNPELAVKHPQLLKQMKMGAGINLSDDPPTVIANVNIGLIQQHIMQSLAGDSDEDDIINITVENEEETK